MDARLDPARNAGLSEGDGHAMRNAGGRATGDASRSLVLSHKLLGTRERFVVHQTNCGMELFSDRVIAGLPEDDLGTATFDGATSSNAPLGWPSPDCMRADARRARSIRSRGGSAAS